MKNLPLSILRAVVAIIFISHGVARLVHWSIPEFANFLNTQGLKFGTVLAWVVTMGELLFGMLLLVGFKARISIVFHFIVVSLGIVFLHFKNGWFVVGHGSNGIEFSLLLLATLLYLFFQKGKLHW